MNEGLTFVAIFALILMFLMRVLAISEQATIRRREVKKLVNLYAVESTAQLLRKRGWMQEALAGRPEGQKQLSEMLEAIGLVLESRRRNRLTGRAPENL